MPGCDADPAVLDWARTFTRHPKQFESQLQEVLPRLMYVQKVAERYDVAGEFVLLPWVESHFQPIAARNHRPAGMWQLMPKTAVAMGLRVDRHFDGRLDVPASANAVMRLLEQYHQQFGDWRVADYAYNAGEFSIRKMIKTHGQPAALPAMPHLPVRRVTREHLEKLLGIACVVREPARFHISLPSLPGEQHLVQATVPHTMSMANAADHAGMKLDALKRLNGAFGSNMIDTDAASYLMMPAAHARRFKDTLLQLASDAGHVDALPTTAPDTSIGLLPAPSPPQIHTVKAGDSLWQIARQHSVKVEQLKRWNHLGNHALKPGQTLLIRAPH
ncbi:transglycosylase SLT domain-containing protein [Rhodanobacter sp. AS-Z3]|nr:transglycosylase SLT domain-containing protein [Rhodanobacter sp. AS-Z3]WEN16878.1 transglycosylase SLT domain-containing protein [Rhodanobacter sp. AS-Z3]